MKTRKFTVVVIDTVTESIELDVEVEDDGTMTEGELQDIAGEKAIEDSKELANPRDFIDVERHVDSVKEIYE